MKAIFLRDNFFFFHQGTDLKQADPDDRKILYAVPPGSDFAVVLEHRIRNLKRTHASHSKGPKSPVRWE